MKFAPGFPERFASLGDARRFMAGFVDGYNHTHHHTGIGLNTPADVQTDADRVRAAVKELPPLQAQIIGYRFGFTTGEPLKAVEIAERLELPLPLIWEEEWAALNHLKKILKDFRKFFVLPGQPRR